MKARKMNKYARELGEVLQTFDVDQFRRFVLDHIDMYQYIPYDQMLNDKFVKGCMAKMILARTDMPAELISKAKKTLDEMGWDYGIF